MENKFSKLYSKVYQDISNKLEIEIKDFMIKQKLKHKYLNKTHNLILERLTISNSNEFYLLSEKALSTILNIYKKKHSEYELNYVHLIFNDMFEEFKLTTGIKSNFSFNNLICELAEIDATNDAYRLFRNSSRISDLMYENNNFDKFSLRKISGNIELDEVFKEQRWIKIDRETPGKYKSQKEFELKEQNNFVDYNKSTLGDATQNGIEGNFEILEEKKSKISNLYKLFYNRFINKGMTSLNDFENVLFKNWLSHSSRIVFKEYFGTQNIAYLLKKLEKHFKNLNQTTIGNSLLFYLVNDKKEIQVITRENLASSFKSMNEKSKSFATSNKSKIDNINNLLTKSQLK